MVWLAGTLAPPSEVGGWLAGTLAPPRNPWSMLGIERFFHCLDYLPLDRNRFAGDARAGCRRMTATTELAGDVVDVHFLALGSKANAGELGLKFFEDAGDGDRFDGAD